MQRKQNSNPSRLNYHIKTRSSRNKPDSVKADTLTASQDIAQRKSSEQITIPAFAKKTFQQYNNMKPIEMNNYVHEERIDT